MRFLDEKNTAKNDETGWIHGDFGDFGDDFVGPDGDHLRSG